MHRIKSLCIFCTFLIQLADFLAVAHIFNLKGSFNELSSSPIFLNVLFRRLQHKTTELNSGLSIACPRHLNYWQTLQLAQPRRHPPCSSRWRMMLLFSKQTMAADLNPGQLIAQMCGSLVISPLALSQAISTFGSCLLEEKWPLLRTIPVKATGTSGIPMALLLELVRFSLLIHEFGRKCSPHPLFFPRPRRCWPSPNPFQFGPRSIKRSS